MTVEIRLDVLASLGVEREYENWAFRRYLKGYDGPTDIDEIAHRLNKSVSSQIDCTKCANCCGKMSPVLDRKDI